MGSDGRRLKIEVFESPLTKGKKIPKFAPLRFPWKRPVKAVHSFLDVAYAKGYVGIPDVIRWLADTDFAKLRQSKESEKELYIKRLLEG